MGGMKGRFARAAVAAGVVIAGVVVPARVVAAASYQISGSATGGQCVLMRNNPTGGSAYSGCAPAGTTFSVNCQQWGDAQGPRGNTLWFNVNGAGRNGWWINDTWTTSPHQAADHSVGVGGIGFCGATAPTAPSKPAPGSSLPAESANQPIWIGAPTSPATWPAGPGLAPAVHHLTYGGQWSLDLHDNVGKTVSLYLAPKNNALNARVNARVELTGPACKARSGESPTAQIARGGWRVVVGVYDGATKVATITYAHLDKPVQPGPINRWGGPLGVVGNWTRTDPRPGHPDDTLCWDGAHVHVEAGNAAAGSYSCYAMYAYSQRLNETNYIGYVGGPFVRSSQTACPSGI